MEQQPNVHTSRHLQNLGIDKRFIESHAGDLNRKLNQKYEEFKDKGSVQFLNDGIARPLERSAPVSTTPAFEHHASSPAHDISGALQAQRTQLTTEFTGMLQGLAQQFTTYTDALETRLSQMEARLREATEKNKQLEAQMHQVAIAAPVTPAVAPVAVQQTSPAHDDDRMVEKTQQIPAQSASPPNMDNEAVRRRLEEDKFRNSVSIDKMFNFSGARKGQGPVRG